LKEEKGRKRERERKGDHETERWSREDGSTSGRKATPRIIALLGPRKEDRVIYNDTLASSNGTDRRYVRWNTF